MHAPLFPSFARNVIFSWEMNKVSIYPSINLSVYPSIHQTLLSQAWMWSGILFQHKRLRVRPKFFLLNCSNNSINPIKDTVGSMFFSYSTFINVSVSHPSFPVLHRSPDQCPRTQRWEEYRKPLAHSFHSFLSLYTAAALICGYCFDSVDGEQDVEEGDTHRCLWGCPIFFFNTWKKNPELGLWGPSQNSSSFLFFFLPHFKLNLKPNHFTVAEGK